MSKATLEFDLNDYSDKLEHKRAIAATDAFIALHDIDNMLRERLPNLKTLDCISIAEDIGNVRVANVVLIGVLSKYLPFSVEIWENVISENVPQKALRANMIAFNTGRNVS